MNTECLVAALSWTYTSLYLNTKMNWRFFQIKFAWFGAQSKHWVCKCIGLTSNLLMTRMQIPGNTGFTNVCGRRNPQDFIREIWSGINTLTCCIFHCRSISDFHDWVQPRLESKEGIFIIQFETDFQRSVCMCRVFFSCPQYSSDWAGKNGIPCIVFWLLGITLYEMYFIDMKCKKW